LRTLKVFKFCNTIDIKQLVQKFGKKFKTTEFTAAINKQLRNRRDEEREDEQSCLADDCFFLSFAGHKKIKYFEVHFSTLVFSNKSDGGFK
jgi:hypothetical protein